MIKHSAEDTFFLPYTGAELQAAYRLIGKETFKETNAYLECKMVSSDPSFCAKQARDLIDGTKKSMRKIDEKGCQKEYQDFVHHVNRYFNVTKQEVIPYRIAFHQCMDLKDSTQHSSLEY